MADGETARTSGTGPAKGAEAGEPSLGRRILRGVVVLLGIVATLIVTALVLVYIASEKRFRQHFDRPIASVVFPLPTDAEAVTRGERLAATRGCLECHGAGGKGQLFLDQMPVMQLRPSNISPGGATAHYSNEDWARAVRNCVRPDGSAILFMPCQDFSATDDVDLGLIVAYLRSLPASNNDPGKTSIGPLGRALFLADQLPLVAAERIPARESVPPAPPVGRTAAYGEYLAHACTGCHGDTLSGGPIPGVPPEWPAAANLTPHAGSAFARYSEADFVTVLREGKRPNGSQINPTYMPWRLLARFNDDELGAIFAYLRTVPPKAFGGR